MSALRITANPSHRWESRTTNRHGNSQVRCSCDWRSPWLSRRKAEARFHAHQAEA